MQASPRSARAATPAGPTAQQLSAQRAAKQATSDSTAHSHLVRLHHLYRRIASTAGRTQQHQYQQQQQRSGRAQHTSIPQKQQQEQPQPEWRALKAAAYPQPQPPVQAVQLPRSQYFVGSTNLLPSVQARLYKASLMRQVLQRRLYRAADIHALCVAFVDAQPLEQRALVRQVAGGVLAELDCAQLAGQ
jgi:hypothetical protein